MAGPSGKPDATDASLKLRLDKWLFQARFFRSREAAARVVGEGDLRLNGQRCLKPGHAVGAGDVLTFVQAGQVRVIRVRALGQRRGPADEARGLYLDLDAPGADAGPDTGLDAGSDPGPDPGPDTEGASALE